MTVFNINEMSEDERMALLFGILLGDGCLSYYKRGTGRRRFCVAITGSFYDDRPFYEFVLMPLVFSLTGKKIKIKDRPKYGAIELNILNKSLFLKIESLGFNSGKKEDIQIPYEFHIDNLMRFVVAGLFSTDGGLTLVNNNGTIYPRLFFTAALPSTFEFIFDYLNGLGIKTSFYSAKRISNRGGFIRTKQQYVLCSNGRSNLEKFAHLIGFVNPKHQTKYEKYVGLAVPRIELGTPCL